MMHSTGSLNGSERVHLRWLAWVVIENAIKAAGYFIALMRRAAAHERDRRQLAALDVRMLQDIGLEPFDVRYGWHASGY
jgi:uncharacterized protein YjiS (DUF1127 family)